MRRSWLPLVMILIAVALLVLTTSFEEADSRASSQEALLALRNGHLFDGTGAAPIEDAAVLIEGNRIVAAGPATDVSIPAGAAIIDARGGLIMPGVIDNHVHVTGSLGLGQDVLTPWLRAGVTSLVDTGTLRDGAVIGDATIQSGIEFLRALIDGVAEPPRVFVAGPLLTAPGGYPTTLAVPFADQAAQEVTGPDDARQHVANLIDRRSADVIKVAIEAGFGVDYNEPGWPVLDAETLAAIAEAAHERGRTVRAHVTETEEFRAALEAGFDVAAHTPIVELPDELLQQAADAGMILVSTANIWGRDSVAAVQSNLARYADLGGRVALGTDFPFQPGSEMPVREMQLLVDGGLTPTEVLLAATKHGAEALGMGDELGSLGAGKLADVIVVDGDPLSNIADMGNVTVVIRDGEVLVGEAIQPPSTAAPSPAPTATPAPALPETGGGSERGELLWPLIAVLVAAVTLAVGGRLLVRRQV